MAAWGVTVDRETGQEVNDFNNLLGVTELAYFDRNIFLNFNSGDSRKRYMTHRMARGDAEIKRLAAEGAPDVLLGCVDLEFLYGTTVTVADYSLVAAIPGHVLWKDTVGSDKQYVFVRKDLLARHPGLVVLDAAAELGP